MEIAVSIGLVSWAILFVQLANRLLKMTDHDEDELNTGKEALKTG